MLRKLNKFRDGKYFIEKQDPRFRAQGKRLCYQNHKSLNCNSPK